MDMSSTRTLLSTGGSRVVDLRTPLAYARKAASSRMSSQDHGDLTPGRRRSSGRRRMESVRSPVDSRTDRVGGGPVTSAREPDQKAQRCAAFGSIAAEVPDAESDSQSGARRLLGSLAFGGRTRGSRPRPAHKRGALPTTRAPHQ